MTPDADLFCPHCMYNLRGIASARCPECGTEVDRAALAVSRIAWVHRREIGHVRAYLRTAWMATFHPGHIARDMSGPVNYQDGRRFAHVTITLAVLLAMPMLFVPPMWMSVSGWDQTGENPALGVNPLITLCALQDRRWAWVLELVLIGLVLALAQRLVQIFFRPRRLSVTQQNRAAALSQYGAATLLWIGFAFGLMVAATCLNEWYQQKYGRDLPDAVVWAPFNFFWILVVLWAASFPLLLYRTTYCGLGRVAAFLIGWPITLGLATVLAAAAWWACNFLAIVLRSLFP